MSKEYRITNSLETILSRGIRWRGDLFWPNAQGEDTKMTRGTYTDSKIRKKTQKKGYVIVLVEVLSLIQNELNIKLLCRTTYHPRVTYKSTYTPTHLLTYLFTSLVSLLSSKQPDHSRPHQRTSSIVHQIRHFLNRTPPLSIYSVFLIWHPLKNRGKPTKRSVTDIVVRWLPVVVRLSRTTVRYYSNHGKLR